MCRMYHRFRASHLDKMNEALLSTLKQAGLVEEEVIRGGRDWVSPDERQRLLSNATWQAI